MKTLLVDDESPARRRLSRLLAPFSDLSIVGEASNGLEALEKIESLRPAIVFLDIEMPELDGLGVARSVGLDGPKIVFTTAYDEYALKAFDANAIDYLVKPVSETRLRKTIERLRSHSSFTRASLASLPPSRTAIKCGSRYIVVNPSRLSAILARDHYAAIIVDGKEFLVEESLEEAARRFQGVKLMRVHRGALINVEAIGELLHEGDRKYAAVLNDPGRTKVPISRERLEDVKSALGL